jgi:hypothetical protein
MRNAVEARRVAYHFLMFSRTGNVVGAEDVEFESDEVAADHGREFLHRWAYEIWEDDGLVARFRPSSWPAAEPRDRASRCMDSRSTILPPRPAAAIEMQRWAA